MRFQIFLCFYATIEKREYSYTMWYCIWSNQGLTPPSIYDCIFLLRIAKGKKYEIINLPFKPIVKWHLKKLHSISFLVSNCKTSVDVVLVFANHYKQTKRGYIYVLDICIIYRITQKLFLNEQKCHRALTIHSDGQLIKYIGANK